MDSGAKASELLGVPTTAYKVRAFVIGAAFAGLGGWFYAHYTQFGKLGEGPGESQFLAVRTNRANAAAKHNGTDMVLRELASGIVQNVGNVNLYDFDDNGRMLAYTVDAADRVGGVHDRVTGRSGSRPPPSPAEAGLYLHSLPPGPQNSASASLPTTRTE